jgi:2-(1,2-epoxy-1,2-dihydrophenyl)acetyl-CoA isomerase
MSHILFEAADGIGRITLNRPEKLNAFFGTMRQELIEVLERANADESVRVVIVTGAGRAFCSGGDVEAMSKLQASGDTTTFNKLLAAGKRIVTLIHEARVPYIAAINGVAAGAGCNLALACDYRIASLNAKLGQTFVKIGLHPDWGGTFLLPRLVGPSRAMELMLSGRLVEPEEALRIGMVDRLAEPDNLLQVAGEMAAMIAGAPPIAVRGIKRAVHASEKNDLSTQIDLESANQLEAFLSDDSAEGMCAFFEKRTPQFHGN